MGYRTGGNGNLAVVSGSGSSWSNASHLFVGYEGSANHLVISDGGKVTSAGGWLTAGFMSSSISNSILITGSESVVALFGILDSNGALYVGNGGSHCGLVISNGGAPLISNTDQGPQFTSPGFIDAVQSAGVEVSMDGRGRWVDNRFIERLWRSVKYEDIYLNDYGDGLAAGRGLGRWFGIYNEERPHQSLGNATPARWSLDVSRSVSKT